MNPPKASFLVFSDPVVSYLARVVEVERSDGDLRAAG